VTTELEVLGELNWVRALLESGQALTSVREVGVSSVALAKALHVSQASAWSYLHGQQFPRRAVALRLAAFLRHLEVVDRDR
jgi:hypothetical protein